MEIDKLIEQKKEFYNKILENIESIELGSVSDLNWSQLIQDIKKQKFEENPDEITHFLEIIINIASNHQRHPLFFNNIERILISVKDSIQKQLSNIKIYDLFESNKRLLLFLIKEEILIIDTIIYDLIFSKFEKNGNCYFDYFEPEMNKFKKPKNPPTKYLKDLTETEFNKRRLEGENDSHICSLIRQDSVEEFIVYVNQNRINLSSHIKPSIFETNLFLNENDPTLNTWHSLDQLKFFNTCF